MDGVLGQAFLFYGPVTGGYAESVAGAWFESENLGGAGAAALDQDGDGRPDLAIGAPRYGGLNTGAVYVCPYANLW